MRRDEACRSGIIKTHDGHILWNAKSEFLGRLDYADCQPVARREDRGRSRPHRQEAFSRHPAFLLDAARAFPNPQRKFRSVAPQDVKISLNSAPAQFEAAAREMLRFDKSSMLDGIKPKTYDSKSSVTKRSEMLGGGSRRGAIVNPDKRDVWNRRLVHDDRRQVALGDHLQRSPLFGIE